MANVSSLTVANAFLDLAEKSGAKLTNMQVQKLVFLAQGYSLALLNRPLFYHNIHAWQFGPVVPKLYKKLQQYGNGYVSDKISTELIVESGALDTEDKKVIDAVYGAYGSWTGSKLSALTHLDNTPWDITFRKKPFSIIPQDLIQEYYSEQIQAAQTPERTPERCAKQRTQYRL
jgi:uncharacterized phage-associated protein